jgi:serine/threonine protein phosphatase 1
MNTYFSTDWHGCYKQAKKLLEQVNFDFEKDTLIFGGDAVDRGPNSFECVELLLSIKNLIPLAGNHDLIFMEGAFDCQGFWKHGAKETYKSYARNCGFKPAEEKLSGVITYTEFDKIPNSHHKYFNNLLPYHIDDENRLFVHGGFNRHFDISDEIHNHLDILSWDRDYVKLSINAHPEPLVDKNNFKEVFVGHTPVTTLGEFTDIQNFGKLYMCDTGCVFGNKLSIINVETKVINYVNYE